MVRDVNQTRPLRLYPEAVDLGLAAGAFVLLAIVAFRRARNVRTPEVRRAAGPQSASRQSAGIRTRRTATAVLTFARTAVGVLGLIGVVWLAVELFR
jgi:hypothetical protein